MNESFTQRYGAGRMIQSQARSFWLPVLFSGSKSSHKSHGIIFTEVNRHAYTCSLYQCTWMKIDRYMSIFVQLKSCWTCKSQTCILICVITYTNQYNNFGQFSMSHLCKRPCNNFEHENWNSYTSTAHQSKISSICVFYY